MFGYDLGFRYVVEDPTYFARICESVLVYGQDANTGLPVGGDYSETCPAVSLQQNPYYNGLVPVTNVEFSGPTGSILDSDGCAPTADPNARWVCFTSIRNKPACQTRHKAWSRLWSH